MTHHNFVPDNEVGFYKVLCQLRSREMLHVLSAVMGMGILNVEVAMRPSSRRTAATADVAPAITYFSQRRTESWMARVTNVFPVQPEAFRNTARDSAFCAAPAFETGASRFLDDTHGRMQPTTASSTALWDAFNFGIVSLPVLRGLSVSRSGASPATIRAGRSSCGVRSWNVSRIDFPRSVRLWLFPWASV